MVYFGGENIAPNFPYLLKNPILEFEMSCLGKSLVSSFIR